MIRRLTFISFKIVSVQYNWIPISCIPSYILLTKVVLSVNGSVESSIIVSAVGLAVCLVWLLLVPAVRTSCILLCGNLCPLHGTGSTWSEVLCHLTQICSQFLAAPHDSNYPLLTSLHVSIHVYDIPRS